MKIFTTIGTIIGITLLAILFAFIGSILGGTALYLLYDHVHVLFPTAAEKGIIAKELSWWDSVCITWIIFMFFKSGINANSKSE
jgi:uncharacterized membrane-anchored protein